MIIISVWYSGHVHTRPMEYSKHRSAVIRLILDLHQQQCPNIDTAEYLISHSLLGNWPIDNVTTPSIGDLYPIENVAYSMFCHEPYIVSYSSTISSDLCTEQVLLLEPYYLLSSSSVCELMDSRKVDKIASQAVLHEVRIVCQSQHLKLQNSMLKKVVDDTSIFAGRNPIVSVIIQTITRCTCVYLAFNYCYNVFAISCRI